MCQDISVRFELQNVFDRDVWVRPLRAGLLVNLAMHVRLLGDHGPGLACSGSARPVGWAPSERIVLKPGQVLATSNCALPSPGGDGRRPWQVIATFRSPTFPVSDQINIWRGQITASTNIEFDDPSKWSTDQMIDFLQNGNRCHLITPLLVQRYRVKDIPFHAAVSPNRGFVVFGRGSIGDGPRVSQLRIQHLILARPNGQIPWRKTIEYGYGDMSAVGNQGAVAVAEWRSNPRGVQV